MKILKKKHFFGGGGGRLPLLPGPNLGQNFAPRATTSPKSPHCLSPVFALCRQSRTCCAKLKILLVDDTLKYFKMLILQRHLLEKFEKLLHCKSHF